jgi:hypothetical protein
MVKLLSDERELVLQRLLEYAGSPEILRAALTEYHGETSSTSIKDLMRAIDNVRSSKDSDKPAPKTPDRELATVDR